MAELSKIIRGLQLLAEHSADAEKNGVCAEHDEIFAGGDDALPPEVEVELESLGFMRAKEGGWRRFV